MAPAIAARLLAQITHAFTAHTHHGTKSYKAVRLFDGKTPFAVHPLWCALTIMQEEKLSWRLRYLGAQVLLYHDLIEDTSAKFPASTPAAVRKYVEKMTFDGFDDEMEKVWTRGSRTLLFKLYDKVNGLLDAGWAKPERVAQYKAHTLKLAEKVKKRYGVLNIVRIAETLAGGS